MHFPRLKRDRTILTILFGASAVLFVVAFVLWRGSTSDDGASRSAGSAQVVSQPNTSAGETAAEQAARLALQAGQPLGGGGALIITGPDDGLEHVVTVSVSADAAGSDIGYLLRDGTEVVKRGAPAAFSVSKTLSGPRPLAAIAVKVRGAATRATCTVSIDGVKQRTYTARGTNELVMCMG
ncbi:hypothetical protein [Aeromicrobium sp.]|uniref:hypothetical protein n=1 Tax=Aeromicrobium sp. TaxID=1871063 RepID=UPI002FC7D2CA